ncbi:MULTISPECIES: DddA-like double-stranded DNA deaminase toxin [Kitasatospora]|nr:DddA-like double-stranded DNA deaminase toxin [Kitasatospora setae]
MLGTAAALAVMMSMAAVPSAEALAAKRARDTIWTPPNTPLGSQTKSVDGENLVPGRLPGPLEPEPADWTPGGPASVPAPGSADVTLGFDSAEAAAARKATGGAAPASDGAALRAGSLPVVIGAAKDAKSGAHRIRVELVDQAKSRAAHLDSPLIALTDTEPDTPPSGRTTKVSLDLKGIGAQTWADRARLVALPACALETPDRPECQQQTPVQSSVDLRSGLLTAEVILPAATEGTAPPTKSSLGSGTASGVVQAGLTTAAPAKAAPTVLAATAGASGSGGSFSATSLSPSAAWGAGSNVGNFTYSYPIQTPPSLGGTAPSVGLGYDSSAVDGKTSAQNSQSSWLGEGWGYEAGFIERGYKSCNTAGIANSSDMCWGGQNATLSLAGHSGTLVRDDTTGVWHLQSDDGTKIEQLTGAPNGLQNGEHWRITTTDGTQFYFGRNHLPGGDGTDPASNSAFKEPVYSPKSGDPCYNSSTATGSWCTMGWRWNLDYAVDVHGNLITYTYAQETNYYSRGAGQNSGSGTLTDYTRAGYLTQIAYGQRLSEQVTAKGAAKAAALITFTAAERCVPSGSITCTEAQRTTANASYWPDTPLDQVCASTGTCTRAGPTFFTTKRLASLTTQVLVSGAYRTVDTWTLTHSFKDPGDGNAKSLWLDSIQRTGTNGQTAVTMPPVTFTAVMKPNRVDGDLTLKDGTKVTVTPFNRPRLQQVTTETGGQINVVYTTSSDAAHPACSRLAGTMPAAADGNTLACAPVKWYLPGSSSPDPVDDWFNKYLISAVTEQDAISGTTLIKATNYTYNGDAAWHRNDAEFTDAKTRTWDGFRGYQSVTSTTGSAYPGEAPRTQQTATYLRGMDGDVKADGSTRSVQVANPLGGPALTDSPWLAGSSFATQTYDQAGGTVISANGSVAGGQQVTATHAQSGGMPALVARYPASQVTTTSKSKLSDGTWRTNTTVSTSDPAHANRPLSSDDKGDGTPGAELCSTNGYATGTNPMMLNILAERTVTKGACGTPVTSANTVSSARTLYDGKPYGQAGDLAESTSALTLDHYDTGGNPVYVHTAASTFDAYGRLTSVSEANGATYDAAGNQLTAPNLTPATTRTAYTPATGAIATTVTQTTPTGWTTTLTQDPGRAEALVSTDANGRATTQQYDGLGRLTAAWSPERATNLTPSQKFSYAVNGTTGPSVVTSQWLKEAGGYAYKNELYDGLGRLRQVQRTSDTYSGRLITDTVYDSHGWPVKTASPYYEKTTAPNSTVYLPQDSQVPAQTWVTFDGIGRTTRSAFVSYGQQQWATTTAYPGADRTDVTPPNGKYPTSTFTDGRNQVSALWQYRTATPTGNPADATVTTYTYDAANRPATRKDAAGNTWSYGYDLRGRQTTVTDPDTGTTTTAYDVNSRAVSTTDGKGNTLVVSYDLIGRKTGLYQGSIAPANQLAGWTYDTLPGGKGKPTSSTRYVGGAGGSAYTQAVTGYDAGYRPTGTSVTIPASEGKLAGTYTTGLTYNPVLGTLKQTDLPAIGAAPAESVMYTYNISGVLQKSYSDTYYVYDVQYDAFGRPVRTTTGDAGTQVVSTQLDKTDYTYNQAGDVTSVTDVQNGTATDAQCFTYDHLGRLTQAWTDTAGSTSTTSGTWTDTSGTVHNSGSSQSVPALGACANANGPASTGSPAKLSVGGPSPYWQSYGYDSTGNRTTLVQHDTTGNTTKDTTTTQTFGPAGSVNTATGAPNTGGGTGGPHALLTSSTTGPTGTQVTSYQYDQLGNTTAVTETSGTTTLAWNGEDKLASVTKTGQAQATSYLYDADGNQLIRRNPGKTTLNLGSDEVTLDTAANSLTDTRYYSAPGGISIARTTGPTGASALAYQASDPHGTANVQINVDAAQTTTRRPTDPFGNPRGTQPAPNTWAGDKGFVGGTKDDTTGLTNLGAREYQPTTGRFLNPDPLLDAGNPQQWNGYAYSDNDPVNSSDPSGLITNALADGDTYVARPAAFCVTMSCVEQTSGPGFWEDKRVGDAVFAAVVQATTQSNGNGSSQTKKEKGIWGQAWDWTKKNGGAILGALVEGAVFSTCFIGAGFAAPATGGITVIAGAAACGAVAGEAGALTTNILTPDADHSVDGITNDMVVGEITGAAVSAASEGASSLAKPAVRKLLGMEAEEGLEAAGRAATGPCNSFPAGVTVLLADGTTKPIEQIAQGDQVTATDPQTGTTQAEPVTDTIIGHDDTEFTDLTLTNDADPRAPPSEITSTTHHPYWNATTSRWTDAGDLKPGDHVRTPDGTELTVNTVYSYTTQPRTARNLTVADLHTYYVLAGNTPVLVHNTGPGCGEPGFVSDAANSLSGRRITTGQIFDASGNPIGPEITSGGGSLADRAQSYLADSPNIRNLPAKARYASADHVEAQYAVWMRENGVTDASVVINQNYVCGLPLGCQAAVPAILPRGSTMTVWYPGSGSPIVLRGVG